MAPVKPSTAGGPATGIDDPPGMSMDRPSSLVSFTVQPLKDFEEDQQWTRDMV
jgi:hypothetical protein